jgi:hypothetical protein
MTTPWYRILPLSGSAQRPATGSVITTSDASLNLVSTKRHHLRRIEWTPADNRNLTLCYGLTMRRELALLVMGFFLSLNAVGQPAAQAPRADHILTALTVCPAIPQASSRGESTALGEVPEMYPLGPDSQRRDAPHGVVTKHSWTSTIFPGPSATTGSMSRPSTGRTGQPA